MSRRRLAKKSSPRKKSQEAAEVESPSGDESENSALPAADGTILSARHLSPGRSIVRQTTMRNLLRAGAEMSDNNFPSATGAAAFSNRYPRVSSTPKVPALSDNRVLDTTLVPSEERVSPVVRKTSKQKTTAPTRASPRVSSEPSSITAGLSTRTGVSLPFATPTIIASNPTRPSASSTNATNTVQASRARPSRKAKPIRKKIEREIKILQSTTNTLIPKLSFQKVVREIMHRMGKHDYRFTAEAMECLQVVTEAQIVNVFELAQFLVTHARRVTLQTKDVKMLCAVMDAAGVNFPKA